jgi:hypothetical protein
MLQKLPSPVGLSSSLSSSSSLGVAISGSVSGFSSLQVGKIYYVNTKGQLIASSSFAGQDSSIPVSGLSGDGNIYYIYDSVNNAYITLNSKIGIATSSNTIFVQTLNS